MSNKQNQPGDRKVSPTEKQRAQLAILQRNFNLSDEEIGRCLFFSRDQERPWIPPGLLVSIARQTRQFSSIETEYSSYVRGLEQLIYKATVLDTEGRSITRTGVATIGEMPTGDPMDEHRLAEGRALTAALTDQGFNPFRSNFVAGIIAVTAHRIDMVEESGKDLAEEKRAAELRQITDDATRRRKDLGRIKILAKEKGLITTTPAGREDDTPYRDWLSTNFQTRTAATMNDDERSQVINALENVYGFDRQFLLNVPQELHADAYIA